MNNKYEVGENITMGSDIHIEDDGMLYKCGFMDKPFFRTPQALKKGTYLFIDEETKAVSVSYNADHIGIDLAQGKEEKCGTTCPTRDGYRCSRHNTNFSGKDETVTMPMTANEVMITMRDKQYDMKVYKLAKWLYETYQSKARIFDLIGALDNTPFGEATQEEVKTFLAMGLELKNIIDQVATKGTPLSEIDFENGIM